MRYQQSPSLTAVAAILCRGDLPDGHTLSLARTEGGDLVILFDDQVEQDRAWPREEIEDAVRTFLARKWELLHAC